MAYLHQLGNRPDLAMLILLDKLIPISRFPFALPAFIYALCLCYRYALFLPLKHNLALEGSDGSEERHRKLSCGRARIEVLFQGYDLHVLVFELLHDIEKIFRTASQTREFRDIDGIAFTGIAYHLLKLRSIRILAGQFVRIDTLHASLLL